MILTSAINDLRLKAEFDPIILPQEEARQIYLYTDLYAKKERRKNQIQAGLGTTMLY